MIKIFHTSSSKAVLLFGFGVFLFLVLVEAIIGNYLVEDLMQAQDEIVQIHTKKKELSLKMKFFAQRRFLGVARMMHMDDIFVIEDLKMERMEAGGNFVYNLQNMLEMQLTKQEIGLLGNVRARARKSANLVDGIIQLIEEGMFQEARLLFDNEGVQSQKDVYEALRKFGELQNSYVTTAVNSTQSKKEQYQIIQHVVTGFLLVIGLILANYIITRITGSENQLARERKQALVTLSHISDSVISINEQGKIEYVNPSAEKLLNVSIQDVFGKSLCSVLNIYYADGQSFEIDPQLLDHDTYTNNTELVLWDNNKKQYFISINISKIQSEYKQELIGSVISIKDVTREREATKVLELQANTDPLTGLANRTKFETRLNSFVENYTDKQTDLVFFMDLDRFKNVNDTCGHLAGDNLLKQISALLGANIRNGDLLARLGGDEFALLLENCEIEIGKQIAKKFISVISNHNFYWESNIFNVGISIGIARLESGDKITAEKIIKTADTSCYKAKNNGRNTYFIFELSSTVRSPLDHAKMRNHRRNRNIEEEEEQVVFYC